MDDIFYRANRALNQSLIKANPLDLKQYALNGESAAMDEKMLDDKFVLGQIALLGDGTIISAKPNAGKTLITFKLLIDGLTSGEIDPVNVYYINADDNHRGLTHKLRLAEKYGFNMLAPGYKGFKTSMLLAYMRKATDDDSAHGVIIILDTLKKAVNVMDKNAMRQFGEIYRPFLARGGSIIMLAHVNKNRNDDGKVIFAGVQDIEDDIDCSYSLDVIEDSNDMKTVEFVCNKSRGDNIAKATYQYHTDQGMSYQNRLDSVIEINDEHASQLITEKRHRLLKQEYESEIHFVEGLLNDESKNQTEIINALKMDESFSGEISVRSLRNALRDLQGISWTSQRGDKNALLFSLPNDNPYRRLSRGE